MQLPATNRLSGMDELSTSSHQRFLENSNFVSKYGWKAGFDHEPEVHCKPFNLPRLSQIVPFIPMSFRYTFRFYLRKRLIERRLPFLDPTRHVPWRPIYGVPAGGIGCGAIGRGFRGEFFRSSLIPGMYSYEAQPADQFILTVKKDGYTLYQQVLSPHSSVPASARGLRKWNWGFPSKNARYVGLYPRSWTVYEIPEFNLVLVCQQISPVIPHEYKDSSLPCCVFLWRIFNFGSKSLDVSISFSWYGPSPSPRLHTTCGGDSNCKLRQGDNNKYADKRPAMPYLARSSPFHSEQFAVHGCTLDRLVGNELPCCFGIAAKASKTVEVKRCPGFIFERLHSSPPNDTDLDTPPICNGKKNNASLQTRSFKEAPNARTIWEQLQTSPGLKDIDSRCYEVPNSHELRRHPPKLAVMVCASCTVPPSSSPSQPGSTELEFALTWHSPVVRFRTNNVVYKRRYARWFPEIGSVGAQRLLEYTLSNWRLWVDKIEQWQNPVLLDNDLPDWYKSALFNELYYLTDGGTVWLDPIEVQLTNTDKTLVESIPIDMVRSDKLASELDPSGLTGRHLVDAPNREEKPANHWKYKAWQARSMLGRDMGLFAYLEGHEYRMFNTIDVHFYSSWALIKLWPKLQMALNYDCADLTVEEDHTETYFIHEGRYGVRHAEASVPHDFGDPENEPWRDANAYVMFPTNQWKDLNPKFILQVWRDWKLTGDDEYLLYMLPIVCRLIRISLDKWDSDGDGMIENSGFPDQTFDTWKTQGISAYTGGLWLACLYAAHCLLERALSADFPMHDSFVSSTDETGTSWASLKQQYEFLLASAKGAYTKALWMGSYYAYQDSPNGNPHSIMAAQLCGYWFLRVAGAPADTILRRDHVLKTLETIQSANWMSVKNGTLGAVNGVLPSFKQDTSNVQAEEFWVGVNYALGATLIMEDLKEQGFSLAGACYNTIYNRFGLQFQTPEAYMSDGRFRCPGYMRPLAIWSMQHALESVQRPSPQADDTSKNGSNNKIPQITTTPT